MQHSAALCLKLRICFHARIDAGKGLVHTIYLQEPSSSGPTFVQWANEWKHMPASEKAKYQQTAEEQRQNLSTSVGTSKVIRHHLKLISQPATGKNKMPYKSIKDNMYQVELKNLPNGVKFRDQSCMGLPNLKEIISARDSLEFSITSTNSVATRISSDELCRLNQDQVEIPNAIQDSLEDEGNQTASVTIPDHNDVPNVMQESLEDDGKQKAFVPNPVEAELLMHLTDSKDTNSVLEDMESSTSDWFEVVKMLKTKKKEKANSISLSGRDMRSQPGHNIRRPTKLQEKD